MATTPEQYEQAQATLDKFLGHTDVTKGEAYRVLRALEVATVQDLQGNKTKIKDENIIFYRTGLQNQRDSFQLDLREFIAESLDEIFATDKQKNSEFNWKMFQQMVMDTISTHLELQFGDLWNKQPYQFKVETGNDTAVTVLALLRKNKETVRQVIDGTSKSEQEFVNALYMVNFKVDDPGSSTISISTPMLASIIFKKKVNVV